MSARWSPYNKRLITFRNNRHLVDDVMAFAAPIVARKLEYYFELLPMRSHRVGPVRMARGATAILNRIYPVIKNKPTSLDR